MTCFRFIPSSPQKIHVLWASDEGPLHLSSVHCNSYIVLGVTGNKPIQLFMYENVLSVRFFWQTMADRRWLRQSLSFLSMFIILLSYPFSLLILPSITSWLICFRLLRQNTAKLRLCGWGKQHFNNWDNNVFFHPNVSVYIAQPVLPHIPAPFDIVTLMDVAVVKLTMKLVSHLNPWLSVYDINTSSKDAELYSRRPHTWVQGVMIKEKLDVYLHAHQQDYWLINKPSSQTSKSVMCLIK